MTKAQTLKAIKAVGRELTVKWVVDYSEWRVSFGIPAIMLINDCDYNTAKERNEALAYYTNDADDALNTAKAMHARFVETAKL